MSKKTKERLKNARRQYRQQFLSGFEPVVQPGNEDGNSKTVTSVQNGPTQVKQGERSYYISIPVIIEQVSNDNQQYIYRILLNDDPDLFVSPYSIRSKKATGQAAYLPKTHIKGGSSFSMVYGVHKDGDGSLSHTQQHPIQQVAPQLYSYILGAIDRTIQCTLLLPERQKTVDDTGQRKERAPISEVIRTYTEKRRGKKVLPEVLPEALPEEATILVETDGTILGGGQENNEPGLVILGSDANH